MHWPASYAGETHLYEVDGGGHGKFFSLSYVEGTAEALGSKAGWQPRLVLRAVRRLQAAAAWCRARAAGRQRAAQEILRQQSKAVEALEAEAILANLKK
jgi:ABC-type nitrate/sulfonate/bicarbonate transport system substrate-binding protein